MSPFLLLLKTQMSIMCSSVTTAGANIFLYSYCIMIHVIVLHVGLQGRLVFSFSGARLL